MKAVVCENSHLDVVELPEVPSPGKRQVVVEVSGCGSCGSDLHARRRADGHGQADVLAEAGYDGFMRSSQQVVMGHEFCGTIASCRRQSEKALAVGTSVVAVPLVRKGRDMRAISLRPPPPVPTPNRWWWRSRSCSPSPTGCPPEARRSCTEPMAIGYHAVRRAESTRRMSPSSSGAGRSASPLIAMLKAKGIRTIVASETSPRPGANSPVACGAGTVVDPSDGSPYEMLGDCGFVKTVLRHRPGGPSSRSRRSSRGTACSPFSGTTSGGRLKSLV